MQNYFALFNLPVSFAVDASLLAKAYREIQKLVHPDRFAASPDAEKRRATQWAAMANDAYATLKDPLKRGIYICKLNGIDVRDESDSKMDPAFLMQQMDWREALEDAKMSGDKKALDVLDAECLSLHAEFLEEAGSLLDGGKFHDAAGILKKLIFLERFASEIKNAAE